MEGLGSPWKSLSQDGGAGFSMEETEPGVSQPMVGVGIWGCCCILCQHRIHKP